MRRPARGVLLAGGLLLAGAVLTGGTATSSIHRTGVSVSGDPSTTGLVFVTTQEFGLLTARRYDEGPGGPVTPPSLLRANQRDSAYGSSLALAPPPPSVPPGGPALLGVAAVLLALAAVLVGRQRWAQVSAAAGGGVLGAVTVLVGLTGGPVPALAVACGLVLGGGLLLLRRPAGAG